MSFFFFNDTATTEIYTLSLHDALPILEAVAARPLEDDGQATRKLILGHDDLFDPVAVQVHRQGHRRSEEHTSELQSQSNLVCRLLLEKKNNKKTTCPKELEPRTHLS